MPSIRNSVWRSALVSLLAGLALSCGRGSEAGPPEAIFVSGRIEGDETILAPEVSGRIVEITVREGENLKEGQPAARISAEQVLAARDEAQARLLVAQRGLERAERQVAVQQQRLEQVQLQRTQAQLDGQGRVRQAEGRLAAAGAELTRLLADLEQNRIDARRYSQLAEKGAVPQQLAEQTATKVETTEALAEAARRQVAAAEGSLEIARAALQNRAIRGAELATLRQQIEEARTGVRLAQADIEVSRAALQKAQANVEDLTVNAPFDGTVIVRSAEPGQVVTAGTPLLTLVDMRSLYLRGFVPEGQIGYVEIGQPAEVYLDSEPETPIPAEVMRVDPEAMFTPENTYFKEDRVKQVVGVKLLLKGGYGKAKLGMPADAQILIAAGASAND